MDEMATESLTGCLLVATPVLADPNFRRTVILVVEHEAEEGTLGVVLNRPTDVPVERVLDSWYVGTMMGTWTRWPPRA